MLFRSIGKLCLFASARSAGSKLQFRGEDIVVEDAATADLAGIDIGYKARKEMVPGTFEPKAFIVHEALVDAGHLGQKTWSGFYKYEKDAKERERSNLQIQLAHELKLALVIHARDAWDDLFDILDAEGLPERTVIHCFTGGPEEVVECLRRGADISIAGVVTFKNADDLRAAALLVPLDRLHVETDSPFLAPVPYRGRTNEPAYVAQVGEFLATLRGEDRDLLASSTRANTARLFGLPR